MVAEELTFRLAAELPGDAGFGRSAPVILPTDGGIVASRRGHIGLFSRDLRAEKWGITVDGWAGSMVQRMGSLWIARLDDFILKVNPETGGLAGRIPWKEPAQIIDIHEGVLVLKTRDGLVGLDADGRELWRQKAAAFLAQTASGACFFADHLDASIACIDARSGVTIWRQILDVLLAPGSRPRPVAALRIMGDRLVAVTRGGWAASLSRENGEIQAVAKEPITGLSVIKEGAVFFKQPYSLVQLDDAELREVSRAQYEREVAPLYGEFSPTVNAVLVDDRFILWTTMHGALIGVARESGAQGERWTWRDKIPGAVMPYGQAPLKGGEYVYQVWKGTTPCLRCYRLVSNPP